MIYDISYAQRGLNIKSLPNKEAIIVRLGINDHMDTEFENHIKQIISCGVPFGLYWFTYAANVERAEAEIKCILQILKNERTKMGVAFTNLWRLPLFIDYEAEGSYTAHIVPSAFNRTAPAFDKALCEAHIPNGLYLNTGLINQYINSPDVSPSTKNLMCGNLWWADWTTRKNCPITGYCLRQTGKSKYNGIFIDENTKGADYFLYNPFYGKKKPTDKPKWSVVSTAMSDDGMYRFTVEKREE